MLASAAGAGEIGNAQLQIAGTTLTLSPAEQTVPVDVATIVETELVGYDPQHGTLPTDLRVLGELTGPEVDGVLTLETIPNEPFRIPRLRLEGDYFLENVRVVKDDQILALAEPSSARIKVDQILLTGVSSRALTLDEIRAYGLAIDEDSFQAMQLIFTFATWGRTIEYGMPVVYEAYGPQVGWKPSEARVLLPLYSDSERHTLTTSFTPPRIAPFTLDLASKDQCLEPYAPLAGIISTYLSGANWCEIEKGGCDPRSECRPSTPAARPMVGVILFPTDISLLHQFFSVVLMVQNGAEAGDALQLRDLFAEFKMPSGLREAETEPPTLLGQPVPVVDPGPDGERGTADDLTLLVAQAKGSAEVFVEGLREGTHIVNIDIRGILEGLPTGPQPIQGAAKGAVAVRDPRLAAHLAHPQFVRNGVSYSVYITLTNIGAAPVSEISLTLPPSKISGFKLLGESTQTIETLNPGDSATVSFDVESTRTGRVISSSIKTGSYFDPSFSWSVGVGTGTLSPDTLSLPSAAEHLPAPLLEPALGLAGLGYSLALSPPSLGSGLPRVDDSAVNDRIYSLSQAGRHLYLGEELFDVTSILAGELQGDDWNWDELRRQTRKGGQMATALGATLAQESGSAVEAFDRFATVTHYMQPQVVLGEGADVSVEVASRTSGKAVAGSWIGDEINAPEGFVRDLPYAELYDLADGGTHRGDLVVVTKPEAGGYEARLRHATGGVAGLHILVPDVDGALRVVRWSNVSLTAAGRAVAQFQSSDTNFTLDIDADGDGTFEGHQVGLVEELQPRPFEVIAAAMVEIDPSAHVTELVFTEPVDLDSLSPRDPAHFTLPNNVSNGGLIKIEADITGGILTGYETIENPLAGLFNPRVVRVVWDNPVSPLVESVMTISGLTGESGQELTSQQVTVQSLDAQPGIQLEGLVYGSDGLPIPGATVALVESDIMGTEQLCSPHTTSVATTDATGLYHFDYVRQTHCGTTFTIKAQDPATGDFGSSVGVVRFTGEVGKLDIVLPGRGSIRGQVRYGDGTIPNNFRVIAGNLDESNWGWMAHVDRETGLYDIDHAVVGTITLGADDGLGNFAYKTVELAERGAVVEQDIVLLKRDELNHPPPGQLRGTVLDVDGTPVHDAFVTVRYTDQGKHVTAAVQRTDSSGKFNFGLLPAGILYLRIWNDRSAISGRSAGTFPVEVEPDRVTDVELLLRNFSSTVQGYVKRLRWNGTVTPRAGAVVYIGGTPWNTVTDENGYYRFDEVFEGDWDVSAYDYELAQGVQEVATVDSSGSTVDRDLYIREPLPKGGIAGQVRGFDGDPLSNQTVVLSGGYLSVDWHHKTTTDSQGYFKIDELDPGLYGVHAYGAGGGIGWAEIRYPGDTAWVTVRYRSGLIKGQTVAQTGPDGSEVGVLSLISYMTTIIHSWGIVVLDNGWSTLTTETDGTFEIQALAGPYRLSAYNALHGTQSASGQIDFHGQVVEHKFTFEDNGTIRGVLYDIDGETPVEGATVYLTGGTFQLYDVPTDAEGRYEFDSVPKGSYHLEAFYEEEAVHRRQKISVFMQQAGEVIETEMTLPKQGSVFGWVMDSTGQSVPGAVVTLVENHYPGRRLVHQADEDGNFAFENIFEGGAMVKAQAPSLGGLAGQAQSTILWETQEDEVVIELEPTGEVEGQVFHPDTGQPVPLAEVRLVDGFGIVDTQTSGDDGEFRFRLLPTGKYWVQVFDPGTYRRGKSDMAEVSYQGHVVRADVWLEVKGDVDGHFYDADTQQAIPGAIIRLKSWSHGWSAFATTDQEGLFEFGGIPEGDFTIWGSDALGRRQTSAQGTVNIEDQQISLDLFLPAFASVSGTVLNPLSVDNLPFGKSANVRVVQGGGIVGAGFVGPGIAETFSFDGLLPRQSFTVIAVENGGLRQGRAKGRIPDSGDDVVIDIRMQAMGSVRVQVVDSLLNPVDGADVTVFNQHEYGRETFSASTGADNEVSFTDIREGSVRVRAIDPVHELRGSAVEKLTAEGQEVIVQVKLQDTGTVRGRVVISDGYTPAAFAVVALNTNSKWHLTQADEDGFFEYKVLPMGAYSLVFEELEGIGRRDVFGNLQTNGQIDEWGTLVLDDADPQVVAFDPTKDAFDVLLDQLVTVTFSEPIDVTRLKTNNSLSLRKRSGPLVQTTLSWSEDQTQIVLTPKTGLESGTVYDVYVDQFVYDLAGRYLDWRQRSSFTTRDVIPPAVIDSLPRNGDSQVPVDTQILVTFSEPVVLESLNDALQMTDLTMGQPLTTTFQLRPSNREVIVTPEGTLYNDRNIRLTVQGVRDTADNVMVGVSTIEFWTPDETPPEITWVAPGEGDPFTAGDEIPVEVLATDNRGMKKVVYEIGDWTFTATSDPSFPATLLAPVVDVASDVAATATAYDIFGNTTVITRTLHIVPHVNTSPPVIANDCWFDGDYIAPAVELPLAFTATDDERIESYRLIVDDETLQVVTPVLAPQVTHTFTWRPAHDTPAGTVFKVQVEARDFAGNVGVYVANMTVPGDGTLLTASQGLFSNYKDQTVYLGAEPTETGQYELNVPMTFAKLVVMRDVVLSSDELFANGFDLDVVGDVIVQCGGLIDADDRGYEGGTGSQPGGAPEGVTPSYPDAGGSHGGSGSLGKGAGPAGETFDSVYRPTLTGGGGARLDATATGGGGGGILTIDAAAIRIDGEIRARGGKPEPWDKAGSGAGGTIVLTAASLGGVGLIDASGHDSGSYCCGKGGGGRVALHVGDVTGFDLYGQIEVRGGGANANRSPFGATGTLYVRDSLATYGELIVDSGFDTYGAPREAVPTVLPALGAADLVAASAVGDDAEVTAEAPFMPRWLGAWMVLLDGSGSELGTFEVVELTTGGSAVLAGAAVVAGSAESYRGEYLFDHIHLLNADLDSSDPVRSPTIELDHTGSLGPQIEIQDLTIHDGGRLRPLEGSVLELSASGTVHVETGGAIDVTGRGYPGAISGAAGAPEWVTGSTGDTGGSHGGHGVSEKGSGSPGDVYDSVYEPRLSGGGGGNQNTMAGGAGGGVVQLDVHELVIDGLVEARGAETDGSGTGAGGSIRVEADILRGSGTIDARGGSTGFSSGHGYGGRGGGGRIAVYVADLGQFDPLTKMLTDGGILPWSSANYVPAAAPGTLYLFHAGSTYGDLVVNAGAGTLDPPETHLPALGEGAVTEVVVDGEDLWIAAADVFRPRWLGAWVTLGDAGGDLGTFRVAEIDAVGRLRLEGGAAAAGASSFRGLYRFDNVDLHNNAGLVVDKSLDVDTLTLTDSASVSNDLAPRHLVLKAGASLVPAAGGEIRLQAKETLTIEAGATVDVTGLGYPGGWPRGEAPTWVEEAHIEQGGSHGGSGIERSSQVTFGPGEVYDSVYRPQLGGGGGGGNYYDSSDPGTAGGGVIHLKAPAVVLQGDLLATGTAIDLPTGAGGTVTVEADTLSGTGSILASGADESWSHGVGGGGRVLLAVADLSAYDYTSLVSVRGGKRTSTGSNYAGPAAPGTLYVSDAASTYGSLLVNAEDSSENGKYPVPPTRLPTLGNGSVIDLASAGADAWLTGEDFFRPRWLGVWVELSDASGVIGEFEVLEIDTEGRALLAGAGTVSATTYRGLYLFDSIETFGGAAYVADDPVDSEILVLSGEVLVDTEVTSKNIVVKSGAVVRPAAGGEVRLVASGTLEIEAGATVDVTGLGYPGGWPRGEAPAWVEEAHIEQGGSHGGSGIERSSQVTSGPGEVYDSVYRPQLGGGGGGGNYYDSSDPGTAGGGVIHLKAPAVVLQGDLLATGTAIDLPTGAGGTVTVEADTLSGTGSILASGADESWSHGVGGGGRVLLAVADLSAYDYASLVSVRGGKRTSTGSNYAGPAAPGTLYVSDAASTYGSLLVNAEDSSENGKYPVPPTRLPTLGSGSVVDLASAGADAWLTGEDFFRPRWLGAWVELADASGVVGTYEVLEIDATGRLRLGGAGAVSAASYRGLYRFDSFELQGGAGFLADDELDVATMTISGESAVESVVTAQDLTIESNAFIRPAAGGGLSFHVAGTMTVGSGALIDVSNLGYDHGQAVWTPGFAPSWVEPSKVDAGGSHGGRGQFKNQPGPAGDVFDSVYEPQLGGGGGSRQRDGGGGAGGGVLIVEAGSLELLGELRARGENGTHGYKKEGGGGGGGTVVIQTTSLSGSGLIDASGGDSPWSGFDGYHGTGGGGRVALLADDLSGFDVSTQVRAVGGAHVNGSGTEIGGFASAGTIYLRGALSTFGSLRIDPGQTAAGADRVAPATELPALGEGAISDLGVDGDDLLVSAAEMFHTRWLGAWAELFDAGGSSIGAFEVAEIDASGRLRLLGAATAGPSAVTYRGLYRFDEVKVTHSGQLTLSDHYDVAVWTIEPGSGVDFPDFEPPVIGTVLPAEGVAFGFLEPIDFSAEVSDNEAVAEVRFTFDGTTFTDTEAPFAWTVAAPGVATASFFVLDVEAEDVSGNLATASRTIQIDAADPPAVTIACPGPGALLAPGTGLDVTAEPTDTYGIQQLDLYVDGALADTVTAAPWLAHIDAPLTSVDGDVIEVRVVATNLAGLTAETTLDVGIVEGQVVNSDTEILAGDTSLDGFTVVVAGGTLSLAGPHGFRDLVVLDTATVTHLPTTAAEAQALDLTLSRNLYVACGGRLDATGRGYLPGMTWPNTTVGGAADGVGGSHGGRGGWFLENPSTAGRVYGSVFDPGDPGAGGGDASGSAGGGVIRVQAAGDVVVDGVVEARGGGQDVDIVHGAGGSIRLDGQNIGGRGLLDASGAGSPGGSAGGGGGRIALYGTTVDSGLLERATALGGSSGTPEATGAAGTVFVKRDLQAFGELFIDGGGVATTQLTELLAVGAGIVDGVTTDSISDASAAFRHDLRGVEVAFAGNLAELWTIAGHQDGGSSLNLDVASAPLTAQPGDTYEGVYRFDRVVVRGGASVATSDHVQPVEPAEVDPGSELTSSYQADLTIDSPADGVLLGAQQSFIVEASAASVFGVVEARMTFDGLTQVDTTAPFSWGATVPAVGSVTSMPIVVEITDLAGGVTTTSISVTAQPTSGQPPVVVRGKCPADRDWVAPNMPLSFPFAATDDETIESYSLVVDGWLVDSVTGLSQSTVNGTLGWTVPAEAPTAHTYDIRIEVRDNAGNVGLTTLRLSTPRDAPLTGDQVLDSSWNGQNLYLAQGTFTVTEPLSLSGLAVMSGATVNGLSKTTVDLAVSGTLAVQCGGSIDVSALGFLGGRTSSPRDGESYPGMTTAAYNAGGSSGGVGTKGKEGGLPGEVYGSVYQPNLPGGGGAYYNSANRGGDGGGVVRITAGILRLDGQILARGEDRNASAGGYYAGAGAGGSIDITASTISGFGNVDASGGHFFQSDGNWAGAGGGGRVRVETPLYLGFDPESQISVAGGRRYLSNGSMTEVAATGTLLVLDDRSTAGRLVLDNGQEEVNGVLQDRNAPVTELPPLGTGTVEFFEVDGNDAWVTTGEPLNPRWQGAWMGLEPPAGGRYLGSFQVTEIDGDRVHLAGAWWAGSAVSFYGEYRFDSIVLRHGAKVTAANSLRVSDEITVLAGESALPNVLATARMKVASGATVRPATGGMLDWKVGTTLEIEAGATLDVSGLGYLGGQTYSFRDGDAPDWVTRAKYNAGGSHLGSGSKGKEAGEPGESFDSPFWPTLPGGGGAAYNGTYMGGNGGGIVDLDVRSLVLDGQILARGQDRFGSGIGYYAGAGGGGTVLIRADSLTGGGSIDATGGDYVQNDLNWAGAGGGGAVAIYTDSLGIDPVNQIAARGGNQVQSNGTLQNAAGTGTVFVFDNASSTYGHLIVDDGQFGGADREPAATMLPALGGTGTVTRVEEDRAGTWVTVAEALHPRWRGVTMVLFDSAGVEVGAHRITDLEGDRVRLDGAAGLQTAETFSGQYRFDEVTLLHGAELDAVDPISAGVLTVSGDARIPPVLSAGDVTLTAGTVARPAAGGYLRLDVSGTLRIEASAVLEVSELGYLGGQTSDPRNGEAPSWATSSAYNAGGSHGGSGGQGKEAGLPGEVYGSVYSPLLSGAGGASYTSTHKGGNGGGTLEILADRLELDGEIRARGQSRSGYTSGYYAGAGGGGSIQVLADTIAGTGRIDASGGDHQQNDNNWGGCGGGGRVRLEARDLTAFDPDSQILAWGGSRWRSNGKLAEAGGTGTILVFETLASTFGRLILEAGQEGGADRGGPATTLPALGGDGVNLTEVEGEDLWLTPTTLIVYPRWLGVWVRLTDSAGSEHGPFQVVEIDAGGRMLLAGAASLHEAVTDFAGEYLFDQVDERGGASLSSTDPVRIGPLSHRLDVHVDGAGTVTSTPAGLDCGTDCTELYSDSTTVTLNATAPAGGVFQGWGGACSGTGSCQLTLTASTAVTATFAEVCTNSWVSHGPYFADVTFVESDPVTSQIWAGTEYRLYRRALGELSWDAYPRSTSHYYSVASAGATKYVGGRYGQVYKVVDGTLVSAFLVASLSPGRAEGIAVDPFSSSRVFVGFNSGGVYRSNDGGQSWSEVNVGLGNLQVTSLAMSPTTVDVIFAATEGGLFKSVDGGASWSASQSGMASLDLRALAIDPVDGNVLYAAASDGVYKSTDEGVSWALTQTGGMSSIAVNTDGQTLYAGEETGNVWKSEDAGATWELAGILAEVGAVTSVAFDLSSASTVYLGTSRNGVYLSTDDGSSWQEYNLGLDGGRMQHLAEDPAVEGTLYAAEYSQLFVTVDGGGHWRRLDTSAWGGVHMYDIVVDAGSVLYVSTAAVGIFKSEDGGLSWSETARPYNYDPTHQLAADPAVPSTIYAGTASSGAFKSTDGGTTWQLMAGGLPQVGIAGIFPDPSNSQVLHISTYAGGLYKSIDGGQTWVAASAGLPGSLVNDVTVDPTNSGELHLTIFNQGIYDSHDGGLSWSLNPSFPTGPGYRVRDSSQALYVASPYAGVYKSFDDGSTWTARQEGLSGYQIRDMAVSPHDPGTLWVAVEGRSVLRLTECADPQIRVTKIGSGTGTVTADIGGISCGSDCSEVYPADTVVTLSVVPDAGSSFVGWSSTDCSGTGPCVVTVKTQHEVTAEISGLTSELNVEVVGSGTVDSTPAGISCGTDCSEAFTTGTAVALEALPSAGFELVGWSGACSGAAPCTATLDRDRSLTAHFATVSSVLNDPGEPDRVLGEEPIPDSE